MGEGCASDTMTLSCTHSERAEGEYGGHRVDGADEGAVGHRLGARERERRAALAQGVEREACDG